MTVQVAGPDAAAPCCTRPDCRDGAVLVEISPTFWVAVDCPVCTAHARGRP